MPRQLVPITILVEINDDVDRKESRLHGLVNNAGIMATPYEESVDHYEAQFQVSYNSRKAMIWTNL